MSSLDNIAIAEKKRRKSPGYYREIDRAIISVIPKGVRVLELGCSTGRLLAATKPSYGLGVDINDKQIEAAKQIHSESEQLEFKTDNVEQMDLSHLEPFDYIIISDLLPQVRDIQKTLENLHSVCSAHTRIIITIILTYGARFLVSRHFLDAGVPILLITGCPLTISGTFLTFRILRQ
jgi:ubiquinone/menaquinone biosynthesis C-methylase UbiE